MRLRTRAHRQRGIAAIEFALVLPILAVMLAFTLFFGRLLWHYGVALKAAHDAATFLAMARITETTISKSDMGEIEVAKVARLIAETEVGELSPGKSAPLVEVSCDGNKCIGDVAPAEVEVLVRMKMVDSFMTTYTSEIAGNNGMWVYAEVKVPYVGN